MCSCLFGYFHCALPEDTIDVEVTVRTLNGIQTYQKDCSTQSTSCSPQGTLVKPFPSLHREMNDYMEEKRKLVNPFTPCQRPSNRQNFSLPKKTIPTKKKKSDSKRVSKQQHKLRKIEGCNMPTKAVMPTFMLSPAIVAMTPIVPNMPAVPNHPATPKPPVSTATNSCETCKTCGRPCPLYTKPAPPILPPHSDWSDEDCNGERLRERERRKEEQAEREKADKEKHDSAWKDSEY